MVLAAGAALAVVGVLFFAMWESWRAPVGESAGGREPLDVVPVSAPMETETRPERLPTVQASVMPPVPEFRAPAATIVEMPAQRVEPPRIVDSRSGGVKRVAQREVARASAASAKPKPGGERAAEARRGAPPVRMQPAVPKHAEERVDADVQVIEAIVTRAR
ncbi:hypothetical protein [Aromatoleum evansii]|uniref:hypothetical protein n=1 Tax=Aromatoleum evansii TaxID=59406 RepID=UPI00145FA087|nr:hypothetical protein [Aromatoleum evansii]NMG28246.1 hypothetical protein [Aromatoleum evansii]